MKSILDFIYLGKTEISQAGLDNFLTISRDLRVMGLQRFLDNDSKQNENSSNDDVDNNKWNNMLASTACFIEDTRDDKSDTDEKNEETQIVKSTDDKGESESSNASLSKSLQKVEEQENDIVDRAISHKKKEESSPGSSQRSLNKWKPDWTI